MYGYASNETKNYLPLPISLAHILAKKLTEVRKTGVLPFLYPDGKTQVTVEYEDQKPIRVDTVVVSSQHAV
jgi:S-adenosylmethionine synthetase